MVSSLTSPGVAVSITDDTTISGNGSTTVPLIIIGTQSNKTTSSGSVAPGTTSSNDGVLWNITSRSELVQTFGNPLFYSNNGTPLNGYELNEYGLLTAYKWFGAYNNAYVLRAPIDYSQLISTNIEPTSAPLNGTVWLDTSNTVWGIQVSGGGTPKTSKWTTQTPIVVSDNTDANYVLVSRYGVDAAGTSADISSLTTDTTLVINGSSLTITATPTIANISSAINSQNIAGITSSVILINGKYYLSITQSNVAGSATIDLSGSSGNLLTAIGFADANGNVYSPYLQPKNTVGSSGNFAVVTLTNTNIVYQKFSFSDTSTSYQLWFAVGSDLWSIANGGNAKFYSGNYASLGATLNSGDVWLNSVSKAGGLVPSIKIYSAIKGSWVVQDVSTYSSTSSLPTGTSGQIAIVLNPSVAGFTPYIYTNGNWEALSYSAGPDTPTSSPSDGTYWYNNDEFIADIMINQNGNKWVGYRSYAALTGTDPNGPIMAGSMPTAQSTGASLVDGDLWIDTADTENYPAIYRYSGTEGAFIQIDNTDDYSPNGIIFKDARADDGTGSTAISDLTTSSNLDPDAPNPELYPDGMLLFNTRISSNNVKEWNSDYFGAGKYSSVDYTKQTYTVGSSKFPVLSSKGRWVSISGNSENGSPYMGRKAVRSLIVKSMKAALNDCDDVLSEDNNFTLICCPGYIELISDMVSISNDKNNQLFVIGDTPARLKADSTSITAFTSPTAAQTENGDSEDAIVTASPYLAMYYPWGLSDNVDGSTIMVPPSTIALMTYGYSDSISYPWKAPAGYTRGIVSVVDSVGYLDSKTGNYVAAILNNGQRNILYANNINPIAYMSGHGIVVWGDKTRDPENKAESRINVSRLCCYLSYTLEQLGYPFLFESNTETLRASVETTFTKYLNNFVRLEGIYDFIVECDSSNNTDETIDNNELWINIWIQPTKTIDFIYIPVCLVDTGTDMTSLEASGATG